MTAAGWYQDPYDPSRLRWWDGARWTEHSAPGAGEAAAAFSATGAVASAQVAPGYPPPTWSPRPTTTNGMAIASLVLGIVWVYWIGSVLAIIFGHLGLGQIKRSGGTQGGRGMAIAGLVLGYVGLAVLVLVFGILRGSDSGSYYYP